jgi:hypothetical protein
VLTCCKTFDAFVSWYIYISLGDYEVQINEPIISLRYMIMQFKYIFTIKWKLLFPTFKTVTNNHACFSTLKHIIMLDLKTQTSSTERWIIIVRQVSATTTVYSYIIANKGKNVDRCCPHGCPSHIADFSCSYKSVNRDK